MQKKLFLIVLFSFLVVILFVKCDKMVDSKVQGKWRYINVRDLADSKNHQEWVFENDTLSITDYTETDTSIIISTPKKSPFSVEYKKRKRWLMLADTFNIFNPQYKYQIVRLDKIAMVIVVQEIQRSGEVGGYSLIELERKK